MARAVILRAGFNGHLATSSFEGKYDVSGSVQIFAHDRTSPFGTSGEVNGWQVSKGNGQVFFLGTSLARHFRDWNY